MEALSVSPVTLVPPARKRAAIFLPHTGNVAIDLKIRSALVSAARNAGLDVTALIEVKGNLKAARSEVVLAASNGSVDVVVVNAVVDLGTDLFGAASIALELMAVGTGLISAGEPWLNLDADLNLVTAMFLWLTSEEKKRRARGIHAGQERARVRGGTIGRPRKEVDVAKARLLIAQGVTVSKVAQRLSCSASHLRRALAADDAVIRPAFPVASPASPLAREVIAITEK